MVAVAVRQSGEAEAPQPGGLIEAFANIDPPKYLFDQKCGEGKEWELVWGSCDLIGYH